MSKKHEIKGFYGRSTTYSAAALGLRAFCLGCLLSLASVMPSSATDPVDVDPDPDTLASPAEEIVVDDISQLEPRHLPAGRYWVRVRVKDGADIVFELIVP